jgi:hypothetical protein
MRSTVRPITGSLIVRSRGSRFIRNVKRLLPLREDAVRRNGVCCESGINQYVRTRHWIKRAKSQRGLPYGSIGQRQASARTLLM